MYPGREKLQLHVEWSFLSNKLLIQMNVNMWNIYFELRMKDQIEERSLQLVCNLSSVGTQTWKKFRLEWDSNPWPLWCWCSALPTGGSFFYLIFHPQFKIIYVSYIYIYLFILHGYITNSQYDQLPVGLIAQLVEHCTGIAEVMGSSPVQAWIFFRLSFRNCLSCVLTGRIFFSIWVVDIIMPMLKSMIINDWTENQKIQCSWSSPFAHSVPELVGPQELEGFPSRINTK